MTSRPGPAYGPGRIHVPEAPLVTSLIDWFIPFDEIRNRTDRERASVFVFTHLFGPLLVQPIWAYLWYATAAPALPIAVVMTATWSFWFLPLLLKRTGRIRLCALISFQILASTSLFASFHYGGFNSPFLHWLVVSLILGLFYQSRECALVLGIFAANVCVFVAAMVVLQPVASVSIAELDVLGWLSLGSAVVYITWMALCYSRTVELKSELEAEAEHSRRTSRDLEQARANAEALGCQRSRFFAKMSHELRTPLNAIIGYSDILLEELEYGGRRDDPRKADVTRIKAAGTHLLSLVSRVLDMKSIETGADDVEVSVVSLSRLRDEISAASIPNVERGGNQFVVICRDPAKSLQTDVTKVRQVLINLLSNAAKFTKDGMVKLELEVIVQGDREVLRATVSDTGIGISPEGMSRIFRDYQQAETETATRYGGTGIGLSISRYLARLIGGEITVKSVPGQGSSFTAWIPTRFEPVIQG